VDLPTVFNINAATVPGSGRLAGLWCNASASMDPQLTSPQICRNELELSALQVKFDRKFSGGFLMTTAYTYGKALGFKN